MSDGVAVAVIALGVVVLLFGRRLALLAAGAGALLGVGILQFLPSLQDGIGAVLLVFGLAIGGGILGFIAKGMAHLIIMIIGFVAGGGLVLAVLGALEIDLGVMAFVVASIGGLIAAVLANRFFDWAVILFAGLVGAALAMRGLQFLVPSLVGWIGLLIGGALAVLGILYQSRQKR
jgi:hypothetical protein